MTATSQPVQANRLIHATSPYLLQHAHNPVDWYEWGAEALEKARREDKPIFLSIGYSACHWCHVMAHESFESEEIAAVMNRYFVNIKVDREERPDLDEIYMQATLILTQGHGGWPMSVWLTPDLKPFFAGTYFPPDGRWGRPGFKDLCERIGRLWSTQREALEKDAESITRMISRQRFPGGEGSAELTLESVDRTVELLARHFDAERGGMTSGGTNKFPPSMAMDLMLRYAARKGSESAAAKQMIALVQLTLDRMAAGGIYDQLAGGICRYSTDAQWLVPHFEKMLYDQALVSRIYVDAYQVTKKPLYARIAREIFEYVMGDLQSPQGGFYSTRDADSEGQEGKYYVWTREQIVEALGPQDAELFCSYYDVSATGNWQDPHEPGVAKNILHVPRELETVAKLNRVDPGELEQRLAAGRSKLLEIRRHRVLPHRDEKTLCEWNGLMIASLARGGFVLDENRYLEAAGRAASFVLDTQYENGRLLRSYREGRTLETAFLSDYACMIDGLLELYEATFQGHWLDRAVALNEAAIRHFWDEQGGGFFFTPHDHEELIVRSKDVRDGAVPSGNSVQLMNLLRLAVILGDDRLRQMAEKAMSSFAAEVLASPGASERFLAAVEFAQLGPVELAIVGDPADSRTQALLRTIRDTYLPNRVLLLADPARPAQAVKSPLLEGRVSADGVPTAYVCRNYACKRPVTSPTELLQELTER